jgi:class I fructose-bisphosphate aldolase
VRSLDEAVRLTKAISAITIGDWGVEDALAVFNGEKDFTV